MSLNQNQVQQINYFPILGLYNPMLVKVAFGKFIEIVSNWKLREDSFSYLGLLKLRQQATVSPLS